VEDSVREDECRDVCNDIGTCEKQTSSWVVAFHTSLSLSVLVPLSSDKLWFGLLRFSRPQRFFFCGWSSCIEEV